jgi:hypothetical protein
VAGYGFHAGTDAFATCLQRESLARPYGNSAPAATVLGVLGILGPMVGAVLAVAAGDGTTLLGRASPQMVSQRA